MRARLGEREGDRFFLSWLRRFGQTQLQNPAKNMTLAQQIVTLAAIDLGALSNLAGEIGEQLLAKEAEPPKESLLKDEPARESASGENHFNTEEDKQAEFYFQQGNEALMRGAFIEAIAAYDHALTIKPDKHEALYNKGVSLYNLGRYEDAIAVFDHALHFKPDDYRALYGKGLSLANLGRYEAAVATYDRALHFKFDDHLVLVDKAASLNNLQHYYDALAIVNQVLAVDSSKSHTFYVKGYALDGLGRYEEAIAAYDQALSIKPDSHAALSNKGNSLTDLGRYEDAIAAFDHALTIKPDDHKALYNKGLSLANLGQYEDAIAAFDHALTIKPDKHEALSNKGVSLANLGRYEDAIAAYDQALHIKPDKHKTWINRGIAAGSSFTCRTPVAFSLPISLQDKSLDQRGYEGRIACYTIGLNHVQQSEDPEGWGELHHYKGRAHYFHGRFRPDAKRYLNEAVAAYEAALTTLTAFPSSHLEVLQDAIRVRLGLNQPAKASECRQQGLEVFNQLLNAAPTPAQKQQLEQKFSGFSQIQVDSLVRDHNPTQALQTAERYKNRTLGWILDTWQESITIPSWAEMQTLLTPSTAALYWHLSPDSLTTFLLTAEASTPIAFTQPTAKLEPWLKKWNQQYQAYRGKGKAAEANKDFDAWRTGLQASLDELKEVLKISELEAALPNVSQLLLILHRDLHCLPLHALFSDHFTISHLPSLQVGLALKQRAISTPPRAELPLLTIADPRGDTPRLESAQIESTLISQLFEQVDVVRSDDATTQTITAKLSQPNRIFNFSGHAWAERQPKQSALYLQGEHRLTAEAICQLNLKTYDLITLSACETAVTGLQTIESDYVGLVSAFLTAGAANIISTLWTVESESNAWLMVKFYQCYVAGDSPAVALRKAQHWLRTLTYSALVDWLQAQQDQINEQTHPGTYDAIAARIGDIQSDPSKIESAQPPYADPYYWAAFTVTGYPS